MPNPLPYIKNGFHQVLIKFFIKDIPSVILSLSLFLGGVWLLSLRIPGWSLFFGLIIIPTGFAFVIYSLDSVAKNTVSPPNFKTTRCKVCGKTTFAKKDKKDAICSSCRESVTRGILKEQLKK